MGKCTKCGISFIGIPERINPDHLCKVCEIADLKKQLAEMKEKAENCNRITGDNFKIADGLMGERNELEKQLTAERTKSAKLADVVQSMLVVYGTLNSPGTIGYKCCQNSRKALAEYKEKK